MRRPMARSRILKKFPRPSGGHRAGKRHRSRQHRSLVCRRGAHRPEEQDHPSLGKARHPLSADRSPYGLDLYLWRHLPKQRQGRGACFARLQTDAMNLHLAEITKELAPGRHAALLLNQAGWHLSRRLIVPENITLVPLPPKCPELNPVENIWQFLRDNWISNRIFASYENLLDHCCFAWNKLIDMPWKIMSIGLRDWAHGF